MVQPIPLTAVPNQVEAVALEGQSFILQVNQRSNGLYMDVFMNGAAIILGVLCENENLIIRNRYLGSPGDFFFYDTQGTSDPEYTGLGDRYRLIYVEQAEIEAAVNGS